MANNDQTVKVRMLRVTGETENTQYFDYRPSFMGDVIRLEWEKGTMDAEFDSSVTEYLLRSGYAIKNASSQESSLEAALPEITSKPEGASPPWLKTNGD